MNISIKELHLSNYRNFDNLRLKLSSDQIIITGNNGIGKTNILEAISFLSPGRGLRYAKLDEISKEGQSWRAGATIHTTLGLAEIDTKYDIISAKRTTEFNGKKISNTELANFASIVWLTPQMEGLFLGPSSDRRRFLDRACYAFYPLHASLINQYDHALRERLKILESSEGNNEWLDIVEEKISRLAFQINKNRVSVIAKLQNALDNLDNLFPKARLVLEPNYEGLDVSWIQSEFKNARKKDLATGRSNFGIHRSDLIVYYRDKDTLTKHCSTGEQKAMLISVTIAQIMAKQAEGVDGPIMLLDETFVHLDETRREYLADFIKSSSSQVWITSAEPFALGYFKSAQVIELAGSGM
ncbi:MAG: DNA replication/repair protein RecF [Pseudomonadota bacterium]